MKILIKVVLLCIFILNCNENNSPTSVSQHTLDTPDLPPTITESNLTNGVDFSTGYYNGNIRSDRMNLEWDTSEDENFLGYKIFRALGGGPEIEDISEGFESGSFPSGWTEYGDDGGWYVTSEDAAEGNYSIRSFSGYYGSEYLEKTITVPQNSDIFISYYSMGINDGDGYLYLNGNVIDQWGYDYDGSYWNYNSEYYFTGSNTEITLKWVYSTENYGYGLLDNIEISGVEGGEVSYSLIETLNDANTSIFLDTTLSQNQYYTYKVATIAEQGTHTVDDVEIKTPLWLQPSNIDYEILSPEVVEVTWEDNSESESSFKVYVEEYDEWYGYYETVYSYSSSQDDTNMVISNISTDTQYHLGVKAYNSWEETDTSYSGSFVINFDPPTSLNISQVSNTEAVYLTWNNNTNLENGFKIQRKSDFDGVYETIGYSGEDENFFTDYINSEDFKFDTSFVYQVCAYNTYSDTVFTDYSSDESFTFTLPPPSNLNANQQSGSKLVDLTWTDNSSLENNFEVERDTGSGFELLVTLSANTTSYTDTDTTSFEYDSTYTYRIRAYNDYSGTIYTDYSNEASVIITDMPPSRTLKYFVKAGPETVDPGENLNIYYYSSYGTWELIRSVTYNETSWSYFEDEITNTDAMHSQFKIKFEQNNNSGWDYDNWFIDSVQITSGGNTNIIFEDDFSSGSVSNSNWQSQFGAYISSTYYSSYPYSVYFNSSEFDIRQLTTIDLPW